MGISIKKCQFAPIVESDLLGIDRQEICYDVNAVLTDGTRQCKNGSTPAMKSVDATLITRTFENPWQTDPDKAEVGVDLGVWFGIEETNNGYCLWAGQEETGICVSGPNCGSGGHPTIADATTLAEDFKKELVEKVQEDWDQVVLTVVVAVLMAAFILLAPEIAGISIIGAAAI